MSALDILNTYISFFEKRGHRRIENSSLVPKDDPTTLFTSSGMQPIVNYLLGKPHPQGKRLVNVQNCFRAQDIDEVGDLRHTTFFRMLGNWSLGDYFKNEEIPWFWEFLTNELNLDPKRLYVSVFEGYKNIPRDEEAAVLWAEQFKKVNIEPEGRIFYLGVEDNWWSRSGTPDQMPSGEPGGPDTEAYFDFHPEKGKIEDVELEVKEGRLLEIGNSVFMTYRKSSNGDFEELPQKNVDFGGGLERLLAAVEEKEDIFQTSLFLPIVQSIEKETKKTYKGNEEGMRIVVDHLISSVFISANGVTPSNKDAGYILRRLIRRAFDSYTKLGGNKDSIKFILHSIGEQYNNTDQYLIDENFTQTVYVIYNEMDKYERAIDNAKKYIRLKYFEGGKLIKEFKGKDMGDELKGTVEISADDAFELYSSHGLSPTRLRSLGLNFDEQELASKIKEHQKKSRVAGEKKFKL